MIAGWLPATMVAGVIVLIAPDQPLTLATAAAAPVAAPSVVTPSVVALPAHEFHVSYTRMAIEPRVISAQIRIFADDLTRALAARTRTPALTLGSPEGLGAFQSYLAERFVIVVGGRPLVPVIVSNVQERDMWSYTVQWQSPVPITSVTARNGALMELFPDQQNLVKVKHLPSGKEQTLFYSGGTATDQTVRF
jgi:hypothetical protein